MKGIISIGVGEGDLFVRPGSKFVPGFILLFVVGFMPAAHAQIGGEVSKEVCGLEAKEEVAKVLTEMLDAPANEKLVTEEKLYEQYKHCAQEGHLAAQYSDGDSFFIAARQCGAEVSSIGSLSFEEMSCCGYDPQRRQFVCPVKIKQSIGFGGAPLPGSREFVFHCVENTAGVLVPVGVDSVHLANEIFGNSPSWQFAVIANANNNLDTIYPMSGNTVRARSILSWAFQPTSCDFQPIWGNALDYRIRLDQ